MRASHDLFGDRPDDDLARDSAEAPPLEPLGLGPLVCEPSPGPVLGMVDVEDGDVIPVLGWEEESYATADQYWGDEPEDEEYEELEE